MRPAARRAVTRVEKYIVGCEVTIVWVDYQTNCTGYLNTEKDRAGITHYIDNCMRRDILYLHEPSCLRGPSPSDVIDANAGDLEKVECSRHRHARNIQS